MFHSTTLCLIKLLQSDLQKLILSQNLNIHRSSCAFLATSKKLKNLKMNKIFIIIIIKQQVATKTKQTFYISIDS